MDDVFSRIWSAVSARSYEIAALLGFLLVLGTIAHTIYCLYLHPLANFPGPKFAAISRLPFSISAVTGSTYKWLDGLHAQYGPVVRISPGELTTISPGAWKDIYLTRPQLRKDPYSQTPPMKGAHSLFTAHGSTHSRIRKVFSKAFTENALKAQSPLIESHVDLFVQRVRREISKVDNGIIDIARYYGYAALDVIADMSFGESFHGLEGDNEHNWIVGVFLGAKFGAIRNSLSHFYPLDRLFGMIFLRLTAKHRKRNYDIAEDAIEKRLRFGDLGSKRSDFISAVLGNVDEQSEKGISRIELEANTLAIVIAGSQLTTVAFATMTYLLLSNPVTYERLRKEIRESFTSEKDITVATAQSLPYLSAAIDETLRIHHPTPIHLPRIVPEGGQVIDGTWIPGKTVIGMALQTAQTSPLYFEDPLGYHPERFLSPSDPRYEARFDRDEKRAFRPFSIGNRNCLGERFVLAEIKLMMAKTFWSFDMSLAENSDTDWMDQKAYLVFTPKPLFVKISERTVE
ncbi:cytochrome P450 [Hypoxylon sp. FL1857]|nr:cytochrome P450 [Hypoxylon sp. FL1857]